MQYLIINKKKKKKELTYQLLKHFFFPIIEQFLTACVYKALQGQNETGFSKPLCICLVKTYRWYSTVKTGHYYLSHLGCN